MELPCPALLMPTIWLLSLVVRKLFSCLLNAIRFGKVTTDRTIKESNLRLRPDVVVEEDNHVLLIDVTRPFDNDTDVLSDAASAKIEKYAPLKEFLLSKGKSCEIYPIVVGALGSWYKQNEILLTKLGMTRRYKSLFGKLCCTDAIKGSNSIIDSIWGATIPLPHTRVAPSPELPIFQVCYLLFAG